MSFSKWEHWLLNNLWSQSHDSLGNFTGSNSSPGARLCKELSTNEQCFRTRTEKTQDSRWEAFKIHTGTEGLSLICLQPKKMLAYPVPSTWPKNQPFPKKALSQIKKWGSIINLTLQTKDALVLLQVRLALKTGAGKELQPVVYQRSAQLGRFFQAPSLPLPLIG